MYFLSLLYNFKITRLAIKHFHKILSLTLPLAVINWMCYPHPITHIGGRIRTILFAFIVVFLFCSFRLWFMKCCRISSVGLESYSPVHPHWVLLFNFVMATVIPRNLPVFNSQPMYQPKHKITPTPTSTTRLNKNLRVKFEYYLQINFSTSKEVMRHFLIACSVWVFFSQRKMVSWMI